MKSILFEITIFINSNHAQLDLKWLDNNSYFISSTLRVGPSQRLSTQIENRYRMCHWNIKQFDHTVRMTVQSIPLSYRRVRTWLQTPRWSSAGVERCVKIIFGCEYLV